MTRSPPVPASGLSFQLLAHSTPSSSRILGDCRAADGNLAWTGLLCGRLIFSSNPEGYGCKSLQPWEHWAGLAESHVELGAASAWPPGRDVWEWGTTISLCPHCCYWRKDGAFIREAAGDPGMGGGLCCWGCGRPVSGQTLLCVFGDTSLPGR